MTREYRVAIAGAGNLGSALTLYPGFGSAGFEVVAVFDTDPGIVGTSMNGMTVEPVTDLESIVQERGASIGIIATPVDAAQGVADQFVRAGITSILNFAPTVLKWPPGVEVRRVDLSTELQILAYHQSQAED